MISNMSVEYIDHLGSDLTVVNSARVSFDKQTDWDRQHFDPITHEEDVQLRELKESDEKLIQYLATNNHWSPFSHAVVTLRMKAPVPIRTQCFKHKQGFAENEVSRRYTHEDIELFMPEQWRGRSTDSKQGSSGVVEVPDTEYFELYKKAVSLYNEAIDLGVAPEQARFLLPQAMMCKWYWTGSLAAYARFYKQRSDSHAQKEIQDLAAMVGDIIRPLYPVSWAALTG